MRVERPERSTDNEREPAGADGGGQRGESAREAEPSYFADPKRLIQTLVAAVLLIVAIYVLLPKIAGFEDVFGEIKQGDPFWIGVALAFNVVAFGAYVALFRGVVGEKVIHLEWRESYQITMAGLAATRLFSAGGAGGILLTYWALRKAGMERRQSVCRMVAFLVLLYSVYLVGAGGLRHPAPNRRALGRGATVGNGDSGGVGRGGDSDRPADGALAG